MGARAAWRSRTWPQDAARAPCLQTRPGTRRAPGGPAMRFRRRRGAARTPSQEHGGPLSRRGYGGRRAAVVAWREASCGRGTRFVASFRVARRRLLIADGHSLLVYARTPPPPPPQQPARPRRRSPRTPGGLRGARRAARAASPALRYPLDARPAPQWLAPWSCVRRMD